MFVVTCYLPSTLDEPGRVWRLALIRGRDRDQGPFEPSRRGSEGPRDVDRDPRQRDRLAVAQLWHREVLAGGRLRPLGGEPPRDRRIADVRGATINGIQRVLVDHRGVAARTCLLRWQLDVA